MNKMIYCVGLVQGCQTQGPGAKSGPRLFIYVFLYSLKVTTGPLSATIMRMWPVMKLSLTPLV